MYFHSSLEANRFSEIELFNMPIRRLVPIIQKSDSDTFVLFISMTDYHLQKTPGQASASAPQTHRTKQTKLASSEPSIAPLSNDLQSW